MTPPDEFYIGYEPHLPPGMAGAVRAAVIAAFLVLAAVAVVVTRAQRPLAASSFEYGHHQTWSGWLVLSPAPAIVVPSTSGTRRYWLVGRGKHGAADAIGRVREGWVSVTGTLISRAPWHMIELVSVETSRAPAIPAPPPDAHAEDGREVELRGEIVDSKCFLGVMNPGERTVHRDCAIQCLLGGVPPMLAFQDPDGHAALAVLVSADGRLLHDEVRNVVGTPVAVRGRLTRLDGQALLQLTAIAGVER